MGRIWGEDRRNRRSTETFQDRETGVSDTVMVVPRTRAFLRPPGRPAPGTGPDGDLLLLMCLYYQSLQLGGSQCITKLQMSHRETPCVCAREARGHTAPSAPSSVTLTLP